jgi:predicted ATP-binding protein involved in virulence
MYIKNIVIENIGSIESLKIQEKDLFQENANPKPIILIGKNGSGKTTLLSSITDAFFELANKAFDDVLPKNGTGYLYYKVSGGKNQRLNTKYGFTYLQFKNKEKQYEYIDKNGDIEFQDLQKKTDNPLTISYEYKKEGNYKNTTDTTNDEEIKNDFLNNSYCLFPADRFEYPHWLNRETVSKNSQFADNIKFNNKLEKSFLARTSLDHLKGWILDIFLDSRADIVVDQKGQLSMKKQSADNIILLQKGKQNIEEILSAILCCEIELAVNIRGIGNSRLKIIDKNTREDIIPSLDNLSAGQSTLLSIFASIIKLSDFADVNKSINLNNIEGIILIDEIDLHLHIELQKDVLPNLIEKFPKVQFVISSHSPFFLSGMNKKFGEDLLMINMPTGNHISQVDDFDEFDKAYDIFEDLTNDNKKELDELKNKISQNNKPLIICEGKTDVLHIEKAKEKLNISDLDIEFYKTPEDWGDSKLKTLLENLAKIPQTKKIIGIFDRDVPKIVSDIEMEGTPIKDFGNNVFAFCLPVPDSRKDYSNISIEFFYSDNELKTEKDGKCLYFDNELNFDSKRKPISKIESAEDALTKKIWDENIGNLEWIHSKAAFAKLVSEDDKFIEYFNFDNFKLIFNKLKEITSK